MLGGPRKRIRLGWLEEGEEIRIGGETGACPKRRNSRKSIFNLKTVTIPPKEAANPQSGGRGAKGKKNSGEAITMPSSEVTPKGGVCPLNGTRGQGRKGHGATISSVGRNKDERGTRERRGDIGRRNRFTWKCELPVRRVGAKPSILETFRSKRKKKLGKT